MTRVYIDNRTDALDEPEPPVKLGPGGDFERRLELAPRFVLYRRSGLRGPWLRWKQVGSRYKAESQATHRVEASGDSVAVEGSAPDGTGPRRVEFRPGFGGAQRLVVS